MCFLREVYFLLMGLNSALSSLTSEQVCQKWGGGGGGGGKVGVARVTGRCFPIMAL